MVAVVIPSYKVKKHILQLIPQIGPEVDLIVVVDDQCPENSGKYVEKNCSDQRVKVVYNTVNMGVGGAVKTGYRYALKTGADIAVKLDGDGQMDPKLIPQFIEPLIKKEADYVKGNRFFHLDTLTKMPALRLFGNSVLSLINKFVNGYWNIMDPTNGYTAIHRSALEMLNLDKIENRYFFESDMLFRLGIARAVVLDMPMAAKYADEQSSLSIRKVIWEFPPKYTKRFFKRLFYNYLLRDFNVATVEMLLGIILLVFGIVVGVLHWIKSIETNTLASSGTVMLAALPVIIGTQLLLSALNFDIQNVPKRPLCKNTSLQTSDNQ